MLRPEDRRSESVGEHLIPPRAPSWLRAGVSGSFSAGLFLVPGVLAILAPVPLLLAYRRHGTRPGLAASLVGVVSAPALLSVAKGVSVADATAGLLVQPGWIVALLFLSLAAVPATLLAWALQRAGGGLGGIGLGAVVYVVFLGMCLAVLASVAEGGAGGLAAGWVDSSLSLVIETWRERLDEDASLLGAVADLESRRSWYLRWGIRLMPSLLVSVVIGMLWINVVYSRWFFGGARKNDDLTLWRLPMGVMYSFMGCTTVVVLQVGPLGQLVPRFDPLLVCAANGLVLLSTLYWLQGVAVTNYYFLRMRLGPVTRMVGVGTQALFMIYPVTSAMFGAMGLADAWFDLRRLEAAAPSETGAEQ